MAVGVSNAFVQLFDAEVKQAYQAQRALAGVVRERTNVEGNRSSSQKSVKEPHHSRTTDRRNTSECDLLTSHRNNVRLHCC
jgi:hypothetical protein